MIRVTTASRLHFGLFALPAQSVTHWPTSDRESALPVRQFGGVGLMIDQPGVQVQVQRARTWSATGPSSERALAFAQRFMATASEHERESCFEVMVERSSLVHVGLGTGTQLGLAIARALAQAMGHGEWDAIDLARRVGRGLRSSLGIHGFAQGGLLVEGGKAPGAAVSPLLVRHHFPEAWHVLLIAPQGTHGAHGRTELEAFDRLAQHNADLRRTETLARLVLLNLLPALLEHDLPVFGEALYDFNRRVGEMFAPWQGGVYSIPQTAELIAWLRQQGIRGVGQSSWGPTVFAVERAEVLQGIRDRLLALGELQPAELIVCRAVNHGARVD